MNFLSPSTRTESNKSAFFLLRSYREFWKIKESENFFFKSLEPGLKIYLVGYQNSIISASLTPCFHASPKGCLCSPTHTAAWSQPPHPSMGQLCGLHGKLTCKPGFQQVPQLYLTELEMKETILLGKICALHTALRCLQPIGGYLRHCWLFSIVIRLRAFS